MVTLIYYMKIKEGFKAGLTCIKLCMGRSVRRLQVPMFPRKQALTRVLKCLHYLHRF